MVIILSILIFSNASCECYDDAVRVDRNLPMPTFHHMRLKQVSSFDTRKDLSYGSKPHPFQSSRLKKIQRWRTNGEHSPFSCQAL